MLNSTAKFLLYDPKLTPALQSVPFLMEKHLSNLMVMLDTQPETVQKQLLEIQAHLSDTTNMRIQVIGNIPTIPRPVSSLSQYFVKVYIGLESLF